MPKVIFEIEKLKELVAEHDKKSIDNAAVPAQLKAHVEQWRAYSKATVVAVRLSHIEATMNAIQNYLVSLPVPEECNSVFAMTSLLGVNIKQHVSEDNILLFMQQLLSYITLVASRPEDEREMYLMKFPPREAFEYQCILGTMERMDTVLQELQTEALPAAEKATMAAYFSVIEAGRRWCSPDFSSGNQPHVASAVSYLAGFDDSHKMGLAMSYDIPASKAWSIMREFVPMMNAELKLRREEHIAKLTGLITAEHPNYLAIAQLSRDCSFKLDGFCDASNVDAIVYDAAKIPGLFPEIDLTEPFNLACGLFDDDSPSKIAALLCSNNTTQQIAALKALRLMGHHAQRGTSSLQFLSCVHEVGRLRGSSLADAFDSGLNFLNELKATPVLLNAAKALDASINKYTKGPDTIVMQTLGCLSYLKKEGPLPPLLTLLSGRAPLTLIIEKLATIEAVDLVPYLNDCLRDVEALLFHPNAEKVVCELILRARTLLSPEQYELCVVDIRALGAALVYVAAAHHATGMIDCIANNFNLVAPTDSASRKAGLDMLEEGLFDTYIALVDPSRRNYNGATFLSSGNVKYLIDKLGLLMARPGKDPLSFLQSSHEQGYPIILNLAIEGDLYALQQVLGVLHPHQKRALIYQKNHRGAMPIQAAISNGHVSVFNYFLTLPIVDLKTEAPLAIMLLEAAVDHAQVRAIDALIAAGAKLNYSKAGETLLHRAVKKGSEKVIKHLVSLEQEGKRLIDIDLQDGGGFTPLMKAIVGKNRAIVVALLEAGANINLRITIGRPLLHFTLENHCAEFIPILMAIKGPDGASVLNIDERDGEGQTALMRAVQANDRSSIDALLLAGADATVCGGGAKTLLHIAVANEHLGLIPLLLNLKRPDGTPVLDINHRDTEGWTPLMQAVSSGSRLALGALVTLGARGDIGTLSGSSLLHVAVANGHAELIPFILGINRQNGTRAVDIDQRDREGLTALLRAVACGDKEAVRSLVEAGADLTVGLNEGVSLLHYAIEKKRGELIPGILTLKRKDGTPAININQQDGRGWTALMQAVASGHQASIDALVNAGADVSIIKNNGSSLIHIALDYGHGELLQYILDLKRPDGTKAVDINHRRESDGYTASMQAVALRNKEALNALAAAGADVSLVGRKNCSLLHIAVTFGNSEMISPILALKRPDGGKAVDINQRDSEGYTALMRAVVKGYQLSIDFIVKAGADLGLRALSGQSIVHIAIATGHIFLLDYLLLLKKPDGAVRIDVNAMDNHGETPLLLLMRQDFPPERIIETTNKLTQAGADISTVGHYLLIDHVKPFTGVLLATITTEALLKLLLNKSLTGFTVMHRFIAKGDHPADLYLLQIILSKLTKEMRLVVLKEESTEGKNALDYAHPSVRDCLCQGLTLAEIRALESSASALSRARATASSSASSSRAQSRLELVGSGAGAGASSLAAMSMWAPPPDSSAGEAEASSNPTVGFKRSRAAASAGAGAPVPATATADEADSAEASKRPRTAAAQDDNPDEHSAPKSNM